MFSPFSCGTKTFHLIVPLRSGSPGLAQALPLLMWHKIFHLIVPLRSKSSGLWMTLPLLMWHKRFSIYCPFKVWKPWTGTGSASSHVAQKFSSCPFKVKKLWVGNGSASSHVAQKMSSFHLIVPLRSGSPGLAQALPLLLLLSSLLSLM